VQSFKPQERWTSALLVVSYGHRRTKAEHQEWLQHSEGHATSTEEVDGMSSRPSLRSLKFQVGATVSGTRQ
jgi:hypothetical protein